MTKLTVRNLRQDEEEKHLEMLNLCHGFWGDRGKYRRLYSKRSEDTVKALIAEQEGKWIGGGTIWFLEAFLRGESETKVGISGDAYVHPDARRQGVYSTVVRARDKLAQNKDAALGISFTSIYNVPFRTLRKHGYVDIFHPATRILVLHPRRYFDFLIQQARGVKFPEKLEGRSVELTVSMSSHKGRREISEVFQLKDGRLTRATCDNTSNKIIRKADLRIAADVETLERTLRRFRLGEKSRFPLLVIDMLRGRLKLRFSTRALKAVLGL